MIRSFVLCLLLFEVVSSTYKGSYVTDTGDVVQYYLDNNPEYSQLLLNTPDSTDTFLNATYTKSDGEIDFHILGHHFKSTDDDFELQVQLTEELMETKFGRSIVDVSFHVFAEYNVYGIEDESMMLLYQLAMFADSYHSEKRWKRGVRVEYDVYSPVLAGSDITIEDVFDPDVVRACKEVGHGDCSTNLAVQGSSNVCKNGNRKYGVRRFSEEEIRKGCYGLCGPWCVCWEKVCKDCCWHPGCNRHDHYCDSPTSFSCLFGKGVVFGKGIHTC